MEDWQAYCRNSLNILSPDLYLFPESYEHKTTRLREGHKDYNKIIIQKLKSKSVTDLSDDIDEEAHLYSEKLNEKTMGYLKGVNTRSKSAFISKF